MPFELPGCVSLHYQRESWRRLASLPRDIFTSEPACLIFPLIIVTDNINCDRSKVNIKKVQWFCSIYQIPEDDFFLRSLKVKSGEDYFAWTL